MPRTITFVKGTTTVTLPVPASGSRSIPHVPAGVLQTGDGLYGYKLGAVWYEVRLQFTRVTAAQLDALMAFFEDDSVGITNEFTYTDGDSTAHTTRFLAAPVGRIIATGGSQVDVRLRTSDRYV